MKMWTCAQCGASTTRGLLSSIRDPPRDCENCGSTEFDDPVVQGAVHSFVESFVSRSH
jgi:DNA-directed RNA polymerase subunit RPC12/RpoP